MTPKQHHFGVATLIFVAVLAALIGSITAIAISNWQNRHPNTLKGQKLELIDISGNSRAVLSTNTDGGVDFALLDKGGRKRAILGLKDNGESIFQVVNEEGNSGIFVAVNRKGESSLVAIDPSTSRSIAIKGKTDEVGM
ncbi:hypothetical protein [Methylocaldum sp.]|uniref:hypothetical protein n=1 Tax=Methylocaldum sp. TaxID=1969727 RepID=UPI002D6AD518|nr:hypothetical protein [Methylocaldum sp.]HYE37508.1 hypothetical protein [Methylocaldum sp.]